MTTPVQSMETVQKYTIPQRKTKYTNQSGDFFIDLIPLIKRLNNPNIECKVRMEARRNSYGVLNYGEMLTLLNPSDGDHWDVFLPGYDVPLSKDESYVVDEVHGIMLTPNGNHKIAISVRGFPRVKDKTQEEIDSFVQKYTASHRFQCKWVAVERFNNMEVQKKCQQLQNMFSSYSNNGTWGTRRRKIFADQ